MITAEEKKEIIAQFGKDAKDTGSAAVQVALITRRIKNLMPHFEAHEHDFHSKRGLMKMIGVRKSFLKHIQKNNQDEYQKLINELGIRK